MTDKVKSEKALTWVLYVMVFIVVVEFIVNITWVLILPMAAFSFSFYAYIQGGKIQQRLRENANVLLLITALLSSVWLVELILRAVGENATYTEKNQITISRVLAPFYNSIYNCSEPIWAPNETVEDVRVEFTYKNETNTEGFFDKEWQIVNRRKHRIICLGDSFTQGIGASPDSSYPHVLESILGDTVQVMNCGIAGSDPFYEYRRLQRDLLKYKPDIVVFAINSSDVFDVEIRLGDERFSNNYDRLKKKAPWWEPIYANSYILRLFIHQGLGYDWAFMTKQERKKEEIKAILDLTYNLDKCVEICKANNIKCVFMFTPMRGEINNTLQVQPVMLYAKKQGYNYINMRDVFIKAGVNDNNSSKYFWPIDGHNKPKGYALIAQAIRSEIISDSLLINK